MANNRLDKLLDSIECGDPSVQACNYEMPSPFRSEFKKPEHGFFVERERPNVEIGQFSCKIKSISIDGREYAARPDTPWNYPPVDKEKARKLRSKPDTFVYFKGLLIDELDTVPDPPSLMEKRKTSYHTQAKIMHQRTYAEVEEEMKRIVDSGEFESGEVKFNAPSEVTFDYRFKV